MPQNKVSLAKLIWVGTAGVFIGLFIGQVVFFSASLAVGYDFDNKSEPKWMGLFPLLMFVGSAVAGAWLMVRLEKESHVAKTCPICGGKDIATVESEQIADVSDDRLCQSCQAQWTPPVSKLAASVKLACSGFMLVVAIALLLLLIFSPNYFKYKSAGPAVCIALIIGVSMASVFTIIGSFRIFRKKGGEMKIVKQGKIDPSLHNSPSLETKADIRFNCSNCGQHIVIDTSAVGTTVPCPSCNQSITVPLGD